MSRNKDRDTSKGIIRPEESPTFLQRPITCTLLFENCSNNSSLPPLDTMRFYLYREKRSIGFPSLLNIYPRSVLKPLSFRPPPHLRCKTYYNTPSVSGAGGERILGTLHDNFTCKNCDLQATPFLLSRLLLKRNVATVVRVLRFSRALCPRIYANGLRFH